MRNGTKKIEDIFPILSIEENGLMVTKNADVVIAFEITYPEIFKVTEVSYTQAFESLMSAVRSLGEDYLVHKQDFFFEDTYQANHSYNVTNDYIIAKNEENLEGRRFLDHKGFVYVILPASSPLSRDSTASALFRSHVVGKQLTKKKRVSGFREKVKSFSSSINQSRVMSVRQLNRSEIVGEKNKPGLLNHYFSLSFTDNNLHDISTARYLTIAENNTTTFVINDLDQFPADLEPIVSFRDFSTDRTKVPASYGLAFGLKIPFNHVYNQILYIPKQNDLATKKVAETKRHFSFSSWSRDNMYAYEQKTAFVDEMKLGSTAVHAHFNIVVFHQDKEMLEAYRDSVSASIQNMGFLSKIANTYAEQLYWSCIPGNASELGFDNFATCLLDNAVALWNLESNYRNSPLQTHGVLLTDRFGTPRLVDLFYQPLKDRKINNRNFTVVGPSGSGKSFTMNNIVFYLLTSGSHVTIVDIGNSYKRLGEIMNAKYIEHTDENPISLNPFYIEPSQAGNTELNEEFKQVITKILFLLFKTDGDAITKSEEVTVYNMVSEYYQFIENARSENKVIRPCFNTFYEFVRDQYKSIFEEAGGRAEKEFDLNNFLYVTNPFYDTGQYGFLLNGTDDSDLSKHPFVIYELDNIKEHPILLPIVTLMITNTYVTKLFGVRGILKVLIIEEAWRAVSSDFFANFLLWAFKTARKHLGSIGVVTQEIEDLLKSQIIKDAIVQNTDIKLILDIRKYLEQADQVLSLFKIAKDNVPQIFSINRPLPDVERGDYRELAVILGDECTVYGTEVSRASYGLYTTEATEVDQIKSISEKYNISLKEAAIEWAESN